MASTVAPIRHALLCPVCKKAQAVLSVHLARVCMKTASKDAIQHVVEKAKRDVQDILQWGRIFTYSELMDVLGDVNPRSVIRLIDELERRHMVVSDVPPSVRQKTTSGRGTSQPATTTQPAESEEVHAVSSGESIQVARDVQHTSRQLMAERGLHKKHPLDHPLLKGFALYLEMDLQNENFKQEVDNVSRFLYYMNPEEPSLEFVKERGKMELFLCELAEAKLSKQTQMNYLKGLKRFLKYHMTKTDLRHNDEGLWDECNSFIPFIVSLQQSCTKMVSKGIIQRRHAVPTEMSPLTPKDCLAVLRAAKNDFLAVIGKVSPRDSPLEMTECCLVLFYLEAIVILKHLQRPGVVEQMTVQEWMKRTRQESGYTVIGVIKHPTSVQQVSTFALSLEEDMWFDTYFSHVRPQLLTCKRSRKTQDDMGGDERFFISTAGRPISGASNDIRRLHQKYQLNPVNSQTARQAFQMASNQMTDSERSVVADYLSHCTTTPDDVVLARKLLGKLAGDSSDSSADEGPSRGPRGAAWGAPSGSYAKMGAQAAYDQLLQTHPVTLDGDVPDRTALSQTSGQFKRQLYERWLKAQLKLRVQHVLSHFGRREPTESRVSAWIQKQGWKSNVPSAASILKDWRPVGSVDTAMDSRHIHGLIHNQKWKGLVVMDIAGKGKGVCATRQFQAGEVVCDYHGPVVTATEGQRIHSSTKEEESGYMFFFRNSQGINMCVDAHSPECACHPGIQTFGRLINHSRKRANLRPRLYSPAIGGQDVILLLALKKINVGEELLFDYGVQRKSFRGEGLELSWL